MSSPTRRTILLLFTLLAASARAQVEPIQEAVAIIRNAERKAAAAGDAKADLTAELAALDALRAKHRRRKDTEMARVALLQALFHAHLLEDYETSRKLLAQVPLDFPKTPEAKEAERDLLRIEQLEKSRAVRRALVGKPAPELNFQWSSAPGVTSLADLRGKVVVIDFWATWCAPCIQTFPNLRQLTQHYAGLDVVVLGVTSIQGSVANLGRSRIDTKGDPKREMALMNDFIKAQQVTWPIVFSREPVFNSAYGIAGIPHVTIVAPDGTVRHNGVSAAGPLADKVRKIDAILQEFGKPTKA